MTRRRWIADEVSGNRAALLGDHADHLARVLRARVGEEFDVVADGRIRRATVTGILSDRVEFELGEDIPAAPLANITLLISVFKFDRMEWAIEKSTELGAARIVPVIARRTEPHLAAAAGKRAERWRRIARQASEQARRSFPPEVAGPVKCNEAAAIQAGTRILLDESEDVVTLKTVLQTRPAGDPLALAFGPEGGWTPGEIEQFHAAGWKSASLGKMILRAETAVIAALAVALSELG